MNWIVLSLAIFLAVIVGVTASGLIPQPDTVVYTLQDRTTENPIKRQVVVEYKADGVHGTAKGFGQVSLPNPASPIEIDGVNCGPGYSYEQPRQSKLSEQVIILSRITLTPDSPVEFGNTFADSILPEIHPKDDPTLEKKFTLSDLPQAISHPRISITVNNNIGRPFDLLLLRSDADLEEGTLFQNIARGRSGPYRLPDTKPGAFFFICVSVFGEPARCIQQDILHGNFDVVLTVNPGQTGEELVPLLSKAPRGNDE